MERESESERNGPQPGRECGNLREGSWTKSGFVEGMPGPKRAHGAPLAPKNPGLVGFIGDKTLLVMSELGENRTDYQTCRCASVMETYCYLQSKTNIVKFYCWQWDIG